MTAANHIPGLPIWVDSSSTDLALSRVFYEGLFGWTSYVAGEDMGGYTTFLKDEQPIAGVGPVMSAAQPTAWSTYFYSEDPEATVAQVAAAGGTAYGPVMTVGDAGRLAFFSDPTGAPFGIWSPLDLTGYAFVGEAGAPAWHELATRDYGAAVAFYTTVFGWHTRAVQDDEAFRYTVFGGPGLDAGGEAGAAAEVGGVWDVSSALPAGVPSHWDVYFGSDNVDASVSKAVGLGATIVSPAEDTDYGRMARISDPVGATFFLIDFNASVA